nr:MAG TPA: hypothetical protein [Caudoviricetes sp.]
MPLNSIRSLFSSIIPPFNLFFIIIQMLKFSISIPPLLIFFLLKVII